MEKKSKNQPKNFRKENLTFNSFFDKAHKPRPCFPSNRETNPEYSERLQKTWENSKDPTKTGEKWKISNCGKGKSKAIKL